MGKLKLVFFSLITVCAILASGCGMKGSSSRSFIREDIDMAFYERVAVLPFENNTINTFAAERMRDITMTQLLAAGYYEVVDKGLVDSVLLEEAIDKDVPLSKPTLNRLGKLMNVQAFLLGSVEQAEEVRKGNFSYPEVSLTLRLIDAGTAIVLWQASGHRSGYSLAGRLFGAAPKDTFQVSMDLVGEMLKEGGGQ